MSDQHPTDLAAANLAHVSGAFATDSNALRSAPIEDPADQAALQPWVTMECYQLSRGRRIALLDSLDLGNRQIVRERQDTAVHKLGVTPADFCTISICTQGPTTRVSEHCGAQADTMFFLPGNTEFDIHIPAGGETAYVGFSQEEFLRGARALNPKRWERPPQAMMPLGTTGKTAFKDAVDLWLKAANDAALRGEALDPAILRGILLHSVLHIATAQEDDAAPSANERSRSLQIGRMARAYVEDRLEADVPPTVIDICASIGVSERALQYAFREYVGLSPTVYFRMCRLNRVRATLAASDRQKTTVTQVAIRFGFLHLGRFAGDYKKMFGEMPSVTLTS